MSACGSYLWNGVIYTTTGTYTKTFTGGISKGCDSVATLNLTINKATSSIATNIACGSYIWNGVTYTSTGTYTKTFIGGNSNGCDSVATLNLTINKATSSTASNIACGSYLWNGVTYTSTGTYTKTFTGGNSKGCDSVATLNLTINQSTNSTATNSACGSYLWNGVTYTTTGTYTRTFTGGNSNGCDSIATLNLTINKSTSSTSITNACGSYIWNGVTYTSTGTYVKTFTGGNSKGCDSVATLHLTISQATSSTTNVVACGCSSYTWNGINYTSNGTYIDTLIGANSTGCDSIATLILTLNVLPKSPVVIDSTTTISGGQTGVIYTISPVSGAVSYLWSYTGTGATISRNGTTSISVNFASNATAGDITVQAISATGCLSVPSSVAVTISNLPVVLSDFSGLRFNKNILLKWTSASEINVSEYNIQRSDNGYNFNNIGSVRAKGVGNYTFNDNNLSSAKILYYQLEIVDQNGSKEFSKILTINVDNSVSEISIYPNPAKGMVSILSLVNNGRLNICNLLGKTIISQIITDRLNKVNIEGLAPGIYIVNILSADSKITSKMIVQ